MIILPIWVSEIQCRLIQSLEPRGKKNESKLECHLWKLTCWIVFSWLKQGNTKLNDLSLVPFHLLVEVNEGFTYIYRHSGRISNVTIYWCSILIQHCNNKQEGNAVTHAIELLMLQRHDLNIDGNSGWTWGGTLHVLFLHPALKANHLFKI